MNKFSLFSLKSLAYICLSLLLAGCQLPFVSSTSTPTPIPTQRLSTATREALASKTPLAKTAPAVIVPSQTNLPPKSPTVTPLPGAYISEITGKVEARQPEQQNFMAANNNLILLQKGQLKTYEKSKARLDMPDGSVIRMGPSSLFTYEESKPENNGVFSRLVLEAGKLWIMLKGSGIEILTPSGVAAVRGSFMGVRYSPGSGKIYVTCLEGYCLFKNKAGSLTLVAGETASTTGDNKAPQQGRLTSNDIQDWLTNNPEATEIVPILTATSAALPSVTAAVSATATRAPSRTPRPTSTVPQTIPQNP